MRAPKLPKLWDGVEKTIALVSPQWARDRQVARLQYEFLNRASAYRAASKSRTPTKAWDADPGDANSVALEDLPELRYRSRDLVRNNAIAAGILKVKTTNVIGTGLRSLSRVDKTRLGWDDDKANKWEREVGKLFQEYAASAECDVERTSNFYELQELTYHSKKESGDNFTLLTRMDRPGSQVGLKLQLLEADRIADRTGHRDTLKQMGGVLLDENGAPLAYRILDVPPENVEGKWADKGRWESAFDQSGRRRILHNFNKTRPGLVRGIPDLSLVTEHLYDLNEYLGAELSAAKVSSLFSIFVKEMQQLPGSGVDPLFEEALKSRDRDLRTIKIEQASIQHLPYGLDIVTADPKRPNHNLGEYLKTMIQIIATGVEVPYEILIKHFAASYSASRAAQLEFWRYVVRERVRFIAHYCQPVYEAWMDEAVAIGLVDAPGYFSNAQIRRAYLGTQWIGDPRGQMDELKEVAAARGRVMLGVSTVEQEALRMEGVVLEDNLAQIQREQTFFTEVGLRAHAGSQIQQPK